MQPCNTYNYQVRRVPLLWGLHRPWLPAATPTYSAGYPAAVTTAQPLTAGACACQPSTAATVPYYAPGTSIPSATIPGSTTVPGTYFPHQPLNSTPVPADQAPVLPSDTQPGVFPNSATNSTPASAPLSTSPLHTNFAPSNPASNLYQVKPIPDAEIKDNEPASSSRGLAPPLLNPRERTASQTSAQTHSVMPAVWKSPSANAPRAAAAAPPAKKEFWNDNGWKSAGR
jgi:hypothetical protein